MVAETPEETVRGVAFGAAGGAPVAQVVIPEDAGKIEQRRPVNHLKRQNIAYPVTGGSPGFDLPAAINTCRIIVYQFDVIKVGVVGRCTCYCCIFGHTVTSIWVSPQIVMGGAS